jgi:hypothetical protein
MKSVSLNQDLIHLQHGGLHRALGVPQGEPIPLEKLEEAMHSKSPHVRSMANFASVLEGFHHANHEK